ncbi:tautomerase family protein [Caballeronia novacaledonica]|uniref:Tautomerase family protein n=1 Tax=Caballeronia novacaledonica TaxID=1544861 RepID=A0AA37IJS2_9BURK|nr:tautomerase family protein [Caballeronia novacaledonica]GJH30018.1 tautomerase family protein [Caballeronia novacaledonica]
MPTYIVSATQNLLTPDHKRKVAKEITHAHSQATGAQSFFAQVTFTEIPSGSHFMGGVQIDTPQVFVHGHIRAGRTEEQKRRLLGDITESIHVATSIEKRFLWTYISELPPTNMVEYGEVLPQPGKEAEWLESLPPEVRDYMLKLSGDQ